MGDPRGFMKQIREEPKKLPVKDRVKNWNEFEIPLPEENLSRQGSRCMDCGVPFCHYGCPLGNLIPVWNDFVYRGKWISAIEALHETNNFPEITGRVCPAPCETSCVLGINEPPVSIKLIEHAIIDKAFEEGWVLPSPPPFRTGRRVAVVGSGPSGLAAAAQLNQAGHTVTLFERADRIGGLLRYGIPDFKLDKAILDRRIKLMEDEGVIFRTNTNVGKDISVDWLLKEFHTVCLSGGSTIPRDLNIPNRNLRGIHFAIDFLSRQNRRNAGDIIDDTISISAEGKKVIVIGGGDTGSDCVGTSIRQKAASVTQVEILPKPPLARTSDMPWPRWPAILRTSSSHEEGCIRDWNVLTKAFEGENGAVNKIKCARCEWKKDSNGKFTMSEVPGTEFTLEADLVLLAMGFVGSESNGLIKDLGVELDSRGNVKSDEKMMTNIKGVFSAGDMRRGQSLVVWAISEGRRCANEINKYLATLEKKSLQVPL